MEIKRQSSKRFRADNRDLPSRTIRSGWQHKQSKGFIALVMTLILLLLAGLTLLQSHTMAAVMWKALVDYERREASRDQAQVIE
ncbi:hypothetical protein NOR51B_2141 [Luminiphilus syltensis NOR5-1B]|uniref:Uncharacterized protein n=2 Tax=Luminiphilus TaxID=1341118 RepID=B8KQI9_9GAMM|nr:hypothetical protein NOR51B_2141 [Luminiphilus syltensis NOR5-1B]